MKKIITIGIIIFLNFLFFSSYNVSFARPELDRTEDMAPPKAAVSEYINPDDYNPKDSGLSESDKQAIKRKTGIILGWLRNISVATSVIAIMVVGYKYIVGSVEEKAEYKKTLIPVIIGCIMAISGTTIVSFIYNNV